MILRKRSRSCGSPARLIVRSAQPTPAQWMHVRSGASSTAAATAAFIGLLVGDVGFAEDAADLGGDRFALRRVAVDDHDVRALGREAPAGGLAHPRRAAGDEG